MITAALGVGLARPAEAPAVIAAIVLFASHHALAKGALFLGTGVIKLAGPGWPSRLVMLGLLAPALALAGAPFTSGAVAKHALADLMAPGALSWDGLRVAGVPPPWLKGQKEFSVELQGR